MARLRDELGRETLVELDDFGLVTAVIDPLGFRREYDRDEHGRVVRMVQPRGDGVDPDEWAVTSFAYDTRGNLTEVTLPDGATQSFEYDATFSQMTRAVDELERETLFTLDSRGNVLTATVVLGERDSESQETDDLTTEYEYTAAPQQSGDLPGGLVTLVTDARGYETELTYGTTGGARGRVVAATYAVGTAAEATEEFEYTSYKMLSAYEDGLGRRTQFAYDNLDRRTSVTGADPDGAGSQSAPVHTYAVTAFGLTTSETDALGRVTAYEYDDRHRLKKVTLPDPDGGGSLTSPISTVTRDAAGQVTAVTDPLGRVTKHEYDLGGRRVATTLPDPDGAGSLTSPVYQYEYDAAGLLLAEIDPLGNVTRYAYDLRGRLVKATLSDPDGAGSLTSPVTVWEYDDAGQLVGVTDALARETVLEYDDAGRLIEVTLPDPDGGGSLTSPVYQYAYDKNGNLTAETDPLSNVTAYAYDARNRLTSVTEADPDGGGGLTSPVTEYAYDDASQLTSVTDALDRVTVLAYDNLGRLLTTTLPDPDGAGSLTSPVYTNAYDAVGNRTSATDPLGNVTAYAYDNLNRLKTVTEADPDGGGSLSSPVTTYAYDAASQLTSVTDPLSRVTTLSYDNVGRLKTKTLPDPDGGGSQTSPVYAYSYDAASNLTSETDPLGNVTAYQYDNLHRLKTVTEADPDGGGSLTSPVTTYAYDAVGQVTSITDPLSRVTSFGYDNLGRRKTVTLPDPDGAGGASAPVTTYAYDAASNLTSETDPLGNVTAYQYDNLYRVKKLTEPDPDGAGSAASPETLFAYDAAGNRTSLTDPVGNVTTWAYDGLDRVTSETNELSDARTFEYDAAGNLVKKTDRNGRVTEYDYDNLHRLTAELWKNGGSTIRTLSYTYDAASQMTEASDPAAAYDYIYDNLGRLTEVASDTSALDVVLSQEFNAAGWRTALGVEVNSSGDLEDRFFYDNLGRLTKIERDSAPEVRVDFAYNAAGEFTSIKRYKDLDGGASNLVVDSTYTYDGIGRLTSLTHFEDTTTFADYDWTYDAFSRVTSFAFSHLVGGSGSSAYTYDNTSQVTAADHSNQTDETYTYDSAGNRTISGYTTGDPNRLTSDGTFDFTYDDEGNRLTMTRISSAQADDKTTEYTWDYRNRLTKVVEKNNSGTITQQIEYVYDLWDRRIEKTFDADGAGSGTAVITRWAYDPQPVYDGNGIALYNILLTVDDSGLVTNRYVHGPAPDQILADDQVGAVLVFALADSLGTVRDIIDDAGNVENHLVYDAFGRVTSETTSSFDFHYAYTGRERDEETGLQYNRARYYDAVHGRFLSEDWIRDDIQNAYRYVGNHPTSAIDPSGLEEEAAWRLTSPYSKEEMEAMGVHPHYIREFERMGGQYETGMEVLGLPDGATFDEMDVTVWDTTMTVMVIRDSSGDVLWYGMPEGAYTWENVHDTRNLSTDMLLDFLELIGVRDPDMCTGSIQTGWLFLKRYQDVEWNLTGPDKLKALQTLMSSYGLVGGGSAVFVRLGSSADDVGMLVLRAVENQGDDVGRAAAGVADDAVGASRSSRLAAEEAIEAGELTVVNPRSVVVRAAADAQHHIFTQARRAWFKNRYGINVDDYVVNVDDLTHQVLHAGQSPLKTRAGWWDFELMTRIRQAEKVKGELLTCDEVMDIGNDLLKRFKLDGLTIQKYTK